MPSMIGAVFQTLQEDGLAEPPPLKQLLATDQSVSHKFAM